MRLLVNKETGLIENHETLEGQSTNIFDIFTDLDGNLMIPETHEIVETEYTGSPDKEFYYKVYYYFNGVVNTVYVKDKELLNSKIEYLASELNNSDYKIIKSYEYFE